MFRADFDQRQAKPHERLSADERSLLLLSVAKCVGTKARGELSIAFVSPTKMRQINRDYRKKDQVTDVLSFQIGVHREPVGEILVCVQEARRQAKEHRHSVKNEFKELIIHGILHTLGFDHTTPKDAKRMLPLQQRILDKLC